MNLWSVSMRNLRTRSLSSALTTVSIAVGTLLISSLWLLTEETERKYTASTRGYDAIVGPKEGSALELVLSTIFGVRASAGFVPFSVYEALHDKGRDGLARKVLMRYAIPQARGDNYRDFPIVGTTDDMFDEFFRETVRGPDGKREPVHLRFTAGRSFVFGHDDFVAFAQAAAERKRRQDAGEPADDGGGEAHEDHDHAHDGHEHYEPHPWREAVLGHAVARALDMRVGDLITPVHGAADEVGAHVHAESICEVVGVLAPTGTAIDRTIYIPISTFLSMDSHETIREGLAGDAKNIGLSAIVVGSYNPIKAANVRYEFQSRPDAQGAWPAFEVTELLKIVGSATDVLRVVSFLVLVVAAVSILVALYNTMNERRREIAIMRSLGARRWQIARIIVQEALLISFVGSVLGVAGCHAVAWAVADLVADSTGVLVDWTTFLSDELWLIFGASVLGVLAGLLPAVKGSLTEVADNLGPIS